jgi:hypothetical protein
MVVTAVGARITVQVNSHKAVELTNDTLGRLHGRLALQLHGSQNVDVWFKDLEIAEK